MFRKTVLLVACIAALGLAGCADDYETEVIEEGYAEPGLDTVEPEEAWADGEWGTFDDWDGNVSGDVDESEFDERFARTGWYGNWDGDTDSYLTSDEFYEGTYGQWDADADDYLNEDEFRSVQTMYGDDRLGEWPDYDLDADDRISRDEFRAGFENTAMWDEWDADSDGRLSSEEWNRTIFSTLDADGDGALTEEEWTASAEWRG